MPSGQTGFEKRPCDPCPLLSQWSWVLQSPLKHADSGPVDSMIPRGLDQSSETGSDLIHRYTCSHAHTHSSAPPPLQLIEAEEPADSALNQVSQDPIN